MPLLLIRGARNQTSFPFGPAPATSTVEPAAKVKVPVLLPSRPRNTIPPAPAALVADAFRTAVLASVKFSPAVRRMVPPVGPLALIVPLTKTLPVEAESSTSWAVIFPTEISPVARVSDCSQVNVVTAPSKLEASPELRFKITLPPVYPWGAPPRKVPPSSAVPLGVITVKVPALPPASESATSRCGTVIDESEPPLTSITAPGATTTLPFVVCNVREPAGAIRTTSKKGVTSPATLISQPLPIVISFCAVKVIAPEGRTILVSSTIVGAFTLSVAPPNATEVILVAVADGRKLTEPAAIN